MEKFVKKRLDGSGTEKVCSSTGIFWSVPFHYWTVQRFQKVSLEYFSASFLTRPDQRFKQNYRELFPSTRKPVSWMGRDLARPVWVCLKSRSCLSPYQREGLSNHGFVSTIRTLKLNGLQKRSNGKYAFAQQRYSNYDDQNNSQYWFLLKS